MQVVTMNADDNGIQIGEERTQWAELIGYMVEINQETQEVQNIVLVSGQGGDVYTLNDTNENIEELLFFVDTKIELLGGYKQSFIEKIIRRCKI